MRIEREEVRHIAALTKLGVTEDDTSLFSEQLSTILESLEIITNVDTTNISPTSQLNSLCNVMRDDNIAPSLPFDDVLVNAPHRDGEFFRVQAVLE